MSPLPAFPRSAGFFKRKGAFYPLSLARANTAAGGAGAWLAGRQVAEAVGSSSHETLRWRKVDSNPRSPVKKKHHLRCPQKELCSAWRRASETATSGQV